MPDKKDEVVVPNNQDGTGTTGQPETPEIDYKAELEKAKQEAELAKKAQARAEYALRHKDDPVDPESEEEKPVSRKELKELLISQSVQIASQVNKSEDARLIRSKTKNEDEAKLVEHYLQTTVVPSGNRDEDIENAIALANKRKLSSFTKEVQLGNESRLNRGSGVGAGQKPAEAKPTDLPPEATRFLNSSVAKKYGITPEQYLATLKKNSGF